MLRLAAAPDPDRRDRALALARDHGVPEADVAAALATSLFSATGAEAAVSRARAAASRHAAVLVKHGAHVIAALAEKVYPTVCRASAALD